MFQKGLKTISASLFRQHTVLNTDLTNLIVYSHISVMPTFLLYRLQTYFTSFIKKLDFFFASDSTF